MKCVDGSAPPQIIRRGLRMRAFAAALLRLFAPAPASTRFGSIVTVITFALGATLGCVWISSVRPPAVVIVVAAVLTVPAIAAVFSRSMVMRTVATIPLVAVHLLWIYIVISLCALLTWTTSPAVRLVAVLLTAIAVASALVPRARWRIATALPLGFWITACLIGWMREDGVIRCDDYFAVRRSSVSVLVPTTDELDRCHAGESLRTRHYPRRVWEAPDGKRLVMTTQMGIGHYWPSGRSVADRFPGSVCDVPIGGTPSCFGGGKAQAVVESVHRDRLFVAAWQQQFADGSHGVLYILPRTTPLQPLAELHFSESVAELYYDLHSDTIGLFSDEAEVLRQVRLSDDTVLAPIPAPIVPGETRYDEVAGEGVLCFGAGPLKLLNGEPYLSVAFRGYPFSARALGGASQNPTAWLSMVWGCDWDRMARRVYVADASLGYLATLDYDSGKVLRRIPTDFGMRYVSFDRERHLVYVANFLRGDIVAIDIETGAELSRWFAGRFVRHVVLTRDHQALLATSNIGVMHIPLDGLRRRASSEQGNSATDVARRSRSVALGDTGGAPAQ